MFILNKNTNIIQECHNKDVIKVCRKDAKNFAVAATRAELEAVAHQEPQGGAETSTPEENTNQGQNGAPEGTQAGQGSNPEGQQAAGNAPEGNQGTDPEGAAGQDNWKELPEEEKLAALEAKKVDELRKIAKDEGIQGYSNMNKDTLVAMIMNH